MTNIKHSNFYLSILWGNVDEIEGEWQPHSSCELLPFPVNIEITIYTSRCTYSKLINAYWVKANIDMLLVHLSNLRTYILKWLKSSKLKSEVKYQLRTTH